MRLAELRKRAHNRNGFDHHELLAALVYLRFGSDDSAARAAWSRMLQNHGWDDSLIARQEWRDMVSKGLSFLRSVGVR